MRQTVIAAAAIALLAGGAAPAQQPAHPIPLAVNPQASPSVSGTPGANGLQVGIGVICDTSQQAQTYISLRTRGSRPMTAVNSVNTKARNPKACGVAAIAYRRDQTMATKDLNGKMVQIVRIHVLAGYDGHGWTRIPNKTQYAIVKVKGVAI